MAGPASRDGAAARGGSSRRALREGGRLTIARRYDSYAPEDRALLLSIFPATGRARPQILEIGAASGNLSEAVGRRERAPVLVGLDVDAATLLTYSGRRVLADGAAPPFQAGVFDLVLFSSALHHVLRVDRTLGEAARVLRRGGRLVLLEPSARHPARRLAAMLGRWPLLARAIQGHADPSFVAEDLAAHLDELGIETEAIRYLTMRGARPGWRGRLLSAAAAVIGARAPRWAHPWFVYVGRRR